eukprot:TRINITY_DN65404_c0_g2_i1.p1 TRINITY_DN65404_c0_g2~~TRINITY_DN65404_c0_g2_i1.p1  ORF type:complete len:126 (-),score=17.22 TRINITY_DN65404_c0_g2_i1:299-676(-)
MCDEQTEFQPSRTALRGLPASRHKCLRLDSAPRRPSRCGSQPIIIILALLFRDWRRRILWQLDEKSWTAAGQKRRVRRVKAVRDSLWEAHERQVLDLHLSGTSESWVLGAMSLMCLAVERLQCFS